MQCATGSSRRRDLIYDRENFGGYCCGRQVAFILLLNLDPPFFPVQVDGMRQRCRQRRSIPGCEEQSGAPITGHELKGWNPGQHGDAPERHGFSDGYAAAFGVRCGNNKTCLLQMREQRHMVHAWNESDGSFFTSFLSDLIHQLFGRIDDIKC